MAKFFKDPDGRLSPPWATTLQPLPAAELTANTEDAAHEKHVPVVEQRARRSRDPLACGLGRASYGARALY